MIHTRLLVIWAALPACASSANPQAGDTRTEDVGTATDGSSAAALPACKWPASLDPVDAGDGRCQAKRHRLDCEGMSGTGKVNAFCLSDDPTRCEFTATTLPGVTFTCHDSCRPDEYAISCGRVGAFVAPPSDCTNPLITPAASALYCCPCR